MTVKKNRNEPHLSFVIPTYNSQEYITEVLNSILHQKNIHFKFEIIIVDDNSIDKTIEKVSAFKNFFPNLKILKKKPSQPKGAAISTNIGIRNAKGEFVCLVDSDVILSLNWLNMLLPKFKDLQVGAVAGVIKTANAEKIWAAFAGRELEDRYQQLKQEEVEHVSTCNTIYRQDLFRKVGMFNENLFYGYDVEMSCRVRKIGYKILIIKETYCLHFWKKDLKGYLQQIVNTGGARLKILKNLSNKKIGGRISGWRLSLQIPLTLLFLPLLLLAIIDRTFFDLVFFWLLFILILQIPQTIRIIKNFKDFRFLVFPFVLLLRNIVWSFVFVKYIIFQRTS